MRGIAEFVRGFMPENAREWLQLLTPLNERYQIPDDEGGRAEVKNSRAEDLRFHRSVSALSRSSAQTTNPLSAEDAGTDATIVVDAHVVRAGSLEISYEAGEVTGLDYDTIYYVFAEDEGLDGGAVTYAASTDYFEAVGNDDRYYVGTVLTPSAAAPPNPGSGGAGGGGGGGGWLP